ncbi:hypothetical protein ADK60_14040 [Streptomyces sp. XY431]|uniref:hypothetical protein n=1 Tax=Streptomyces sp. XY431 TaxID=1415562 RepID=UPI0006AE07FB|nr:hypothetical protein [Streptomyces sp. XY431]KOV32369.1 hypothetical protein ADK60_14040 [Streptomyces sp. XY431]
MTGPRWVAVFTVVQQGTELEELRPVADWDDDRNALILDRRAGRLVQASKQPGFRAVRESAGYEHSIPAPAGWTVRWCRDGEDDIVDPVVAFLEDPSVYGAVPLVADLETCTVHDIHWMLRHGEQRRGRRPILMPPAT